MYYAAETKRLVDLTAQQLHTPPPSTTNTISSSPQVY